MDFADAMQNGEPQDRPALPRRGGELVKLFERHFFIGLVFKSGQGMTGRTAFGAGDSGEGCDAPGGRIGDELDGRVDAQGVMGEFDPVVMHGPIPPDSNSTGGRFQLYWFGSDMR